MNPDRLHELLAIALELAQAAEREILPHYQRCAVDLKADGSEVTQADRAAEQAIRALLAQRCPTHAILGEEFGGEREAAQQWIIDPLDGTSAFALGMPLFGTLIAYAEHGEPLVGVIHFPVLGETVYAAKGLGCWFRRGDGEPQRVRVGTAARIEDAVISASGVHATDIHPDRHGVAYRLTPLLRRARKFRVCGDCLQHALVCRGSVHVAVDTIMQPWDIAALVPCIEEAGGVATSLSGQREGIVFGGSLLASCSETLHRDVLQVLNDSPLPAA